MVMTLISIAAGTTLSALTNIETLCGVFASTFPNQIVEVRGQNRLVTLDKSIHRYGSVGSVRLRFNASEWRSKDRLEAALFGSNYPLLTTSATICISTYDRNGWISPFICIAEQPYITAEGGDGAALVGGTYLTFDLPIHDPVLQTVIKSSNATITASERLVLGDTTSGSITLTLPAAASVTAYTVFGFVKRSSANTLILDANGSETINGETTYALTALNERVDIYSTGSKWKLHRQGG